MTRNLILGVVYRYGFEDIEPFVVSLRRSGFEGHVCLYVADLTIETRRSLQEFGIELRDFHYSSRWRRRGRQTRLWKSLRWIGRPSIEFAGPWLLNLELLRYVLYRRYLREHAGRFDGVLLTDVRDVVFQADPFPAEPIEGLWVFEEPATLGGEPANRRWIEKLYGPAALAELAGETVLCSGTTMGSVEAVLRYCDALLDETLRARRLYMVGVDQGIHNYILRSGHLATNDEVRFFAHGRGPVVSLAKAERGEFQLDSELRLRAPDGRLVPLVHQYDRHPDLFEQLCAKYRA